MLRYLTAGESHGQGLLGIIDGVPAGLVLSPDHINKDLARRQHGYGRGGRMKLERDMAEIRAGLFKGRTTGAPVGIWIANADWRDFDDDPAPARTVPRPGHADLAGSLKYGLEDMRAVTERSSARETAMRVAIGAVAKTLLAELGVDVLGWVAELGGIPASWPALANAALRPVTDASPVRCPDAAAEAGMIDKIKDCQQAGDTLGGVMAVRAEGVVPGLGSFAQWDRRLDGLLAQALMGIHAMKGVEIGGGFAAARRTGSQVHDQMAPGAPVGRLTNEAGGLEGGMTNGEPVVVRVAMKPISTLRTPLASVDMATGEAAQAAYVRSDVCALPAACVIGEAAVAWVLAEAALEKFGGDTIEDLRGAWDQYRHRIHWDRAGLPGAAL